MNFFRGLAVAGKFLVGLIFCAAIAFCTYQAAKAADTPARSARCRRAEYPYLQLMVYSCSHLTHKVPVIVLDPQNYLRLKGEVERCIGRELRLGEPLKMCGIPVIPSGAVPPGPKVTT